MKTPMLILVTVALGAVAQAGSSIDPAARHSYGANIGWLDWQYDTSTPEGVTVSSYLLHGMIYSANVGWINTGAGTPANGRQYVQTAGEWGVNHDGSGGLTGYAYGANIGWISFDDNIAEPPRVDLTTGAMSGYAYSANVGWISLDGLTACIDTGPDTDSDGIADAWEFEMQSLAGHPLDLTEMDGSTDSDGDGDTDLEEYEADTNPFDANDYFRITSFSRTPVQADLGWNGSSRRVYQVKTSETLTSWTNVGPVTPLFSATVPTGGKTKLFFRVESKFPTKP
ncbi:MAG: hypothetical protein AAGI48_04960 [Verrucomicrobiota bacterium]